MLLLYQEKRHFQLQMHQWRFG